MVQQSEPASVGLIETLLWGGRFSRQNKHLAAILVRDQTLSILFCKLSKLDIFGQCHLKENQKIQE